VVINLPELSLIGVGADFDAAKADLIDELHAYAEQFRASVLLSRASNRVNHEAHLQWLEAAEAEGQLEELLFAAPGDKLPPRPDDEGRAYTRLIGDNVTFGPIKGNDLFQRRHQDEQERQARS
jgi:hypothetical protein